MAVPSGTITLAADVVLLYSDTAALEPLGSSGTGTIIQVGSDVTEWAVDDLIYYNVSQTLSFREGGNTFIVIKQEYIYLKYTAAP